MTLHKLTLKIQLWFWPPSGQFRIKQEFLNNVTYRLFLQSSWVSGVDVSSHGWGHFHGFHRGRDGSVGFQVGFQCTSWFSFDWSSPWSCTRRRSLEFKGRFVWSSIARTSFIQVNATVGFLNDAGVDRNSVLQIRTKVAVDLVTGHLWSHAASGWR